MTWSRIALVALATALVTACAADAPHPPPWWGDFPHGDHPVGLRTSQLTRVDTDGATRTLTLVMWYPATARDEHEPVRLADLLRLVQDEGQLPETLDVLPPHALAAAMTGDSLAIAADTASVALASATGAYHDLSFAAGPFPLILWSSRHATVLAQAPMAETLASHGMVVATVWSSDPPLAFLWEDHPVEDKLATIEAHAEDLQHAVDALRDNPAVDGQRVVALAWSYGGQTAARLQERDDAVRAVISLDANVLPARPEERLDLRRPLVYFVGDDVAGRGFDRVDGLTAPWIVVGLPELAHGNFNALEGYLPARLGADTVYSWSRSGPIARDGYRALVRMVVEATSSFATVAAPNLPDLVARLQETAAPLTAEIRASTN